MFETTKILILQNTRSLFSKMKESPILYSIFTAMTIFSILIFAYTTFFLLTIETELDVNLEDVYFIVFFFNNIFK